MRRILSKPPSWIQFSKFSQPISVYLCGAQVTVKGFSPYLEGLSVTMPFKEDIISMMDEIDEMATKIGAVNTVVREGKGWKGYNTDCMGALKALEKHV